MTAVEQLDCNPVHQGRTGISVTTRATSHT